MDYPAFFDEVPAISLADPLAGLLGAFGGGVVRYGYVDAVKLAGHSCPTVASAYGLTRAALRTLYGEALPERGGIRVELRGRAHEGVVGVIAGVIGLLTGAAGEGGFKGLGGRYTRRDLLSFGADVPLEVRYTRTDGGGRVDAMADLGRVPPLAEMGELMPRCLAGTASGAESARFAELWQERVRRILIDHADDPAVFVVRRAS